MSNIPHTSGSATEQLPPSYSTTQQPPQHPPQQPTQQGMVAAPQVFYPMGPGGQPQVFYPQQPMAMVAQPYTVGSLTNVSSTVSGLWKSDTLSIKPT